MWCGISLALCLCILATIEGAPCGHGGRCRHGHHGHDHHGHEHHGHEHGSHEHHHHDDDDSHGHGRSRSRYGLMCSITDVNGDDLDIPGHRQPGDCAEGSSCSVGPLTMTVGTTISLVSFCDSTDEDGNLRILRGACRIVLEDGTEVVSRRRSHCVDCCTEGPLPGPITYNGQPALVYFPSHGRRQGK